MAESPRIDRRRDRDFSQRYHFVAKRHDPQKIVVRRLQRDFPSLVNAIEAVQRRGPVAVFDQLVDGLLAYLTRNL